MNEVMSVRSCDCRVTWKTNITLTSRRRLTMATIIFLPLTLLTGYFASLSSPVYCNTELTSFTQGMNFSSMWSVDQHSDLLFVPLFDIPMLWLLLIEPQYRFWEIAIPVMLVIIPCFALPDFKRMFHYIQKRMSTKNAIKVSTWR